MRCINPVMYCFGLFAVGNCFTSVFGKGCGDIGLIHG